MACAQWSSASARMQGPHWLRRANADGRVRSGPYLGMILSENRSHFALARPFGSGSGLGSALRPLLTQSHLFGELRTRNGVVRRDHGIVRRQAPFVAILLRRHVVLRAQMAL